MLSHHMVIQEGKIANYQPYPPTPWNASPRDVYGTPGPYEDAVQNTPIFEENGPENFKGIDIMRAVRSFDPCLPCGVHMYTGGGQGAQGDAHADGAGVEAMDTRASCVERVQELQAQARRDRSSSAHARSSRRSSWPRSCRCTATASSGSSASLLAGGSRGERLAAALADDPLVATCC